MRFFRRQVQHIGLQEISDLIDDRLPGHRKEQVEAHVLSCDLCREELQGLKYTVGLLQQAPMLAPRRRLAMQEVPPPVAARSLVASWAYGAAASVAAVLLAVVLGADLMGALPGGGNDFAAEESSFPVEQSAFSDDQIESEFALDAEEVASDDVGILSESSEDEQVALKELPERAQESEPLEEARAARITTEAPVEGEEHKETHVLWRALEGVLAGSLALLLGVGLWRLLRSRRPTP